MSERLSRPRGERAGVLAVVPIDRRPLLWTRARRLADVARRGAGLRPVSSARLERLGSSALWRVAARAERRAARVTLFEGVRA